MNNRWHFETPEKQNIDIRVKNVFVVKEKWNFQIDVLDVMDGLAFAEVSTSSTLNYAQLAKIDGQWKIINILRKVSPPR